MLGLRAKEWVLKCLSSRGVGSKGGAGGVYDGAGSSAGLDVGGKTDAKASLGRTGGAETRHEGRVLYIL